MPLTIKQEQAVQEFLTNGGNKTQAYKSAYSTSNMKEETINKKACELFKKGNVRGRLKQLQKEIEKEGKISREWVMEKAKEMVDRSLTPDAIFTRSGEFTGEFKYDSAGASAGMKIINQMMGYNAPEKLEVKETKSFEDFYNE